MPTIITHTVVAVAAGKAFSEGSMPRNYWRAAIVSSIIADGDVVAFFDAPDFIGIKRDRDNGFVF